MENETDNVEITTLGTYDPTMEIEHQVVEDPTDDTELLDVEPDIEQVESDVEVSTDTDGFEVIRISAARQSRAVSSISIDRSFQKYQLVLGGETVSVVFPVDSDLKVIDGMLVNVGSTNVTGTILETDDRVPVQSYIQRTYTLLPLLNASGNTNRYRYGALGYVTTYSVNQQNTVVSSQSYMNNSCDKLPSLGKFTTFESIMIVLAILLCCIQFIGGIIRK